jgi:hypothetical protein
MLFIDEIASGGAVTTRGEYFVKQGNLEMILL